jgi:hypothetical protein
MFLYGWLIAKCAAIWQADAALPVYLLAWAFRNAYIRLAMVLRTASGTMRECLRRSLTASQTHV